MKFLSVDSLLGIMLFVACCFPYISLIDTPFDTQPYAIILATLIIVLFYLYKKDLGIPKMLLPFMLILAYSITLFLLAESISMGLRSIVGYASVPLIAWASFATFKYIKGKYFILVVVTWLLFGIVQLLIAKDFGSFILPRLSTSDTRGITSLATEPSFYAITCLFFFVLNDLFYSRKEYSKKTYLFVFALLCIQMLLSRAGVGIALFFVYLIAKMVSQGDIKRILKQTVVLISLSVVFFLLFTNIETLKFSRLGSLLTTALENPTTLLYTDGSISDRLVHIILSHLSLFYSYGLGLGLGNWSEYSWSIAHWIGGFPLELAKVNITEKGRIMSGWGTTIFELGFIGIFFLGAFVYIMYRGYRSGNKTLKRLYLSSFIIIYFIMLNAVPISYPLFGFLIGAFIYTQIENRKDNNERLVAK